ncbi:hypothetical protein CKM354_000861300 [Cercospora kikuchii]|uniref:MIT domain-containing protein n=1 Tax=Cercospora kikuchii TaxID=84275 RepID=A0A9P3CLK7_9PEZI|nr:uncharacterized protein CKM354_000861300 [Cercospora kikuchii]GIZ45447.1 hypothetical protein CKM354_000861300 [Cercospora kikuchii]
MAEAAALTTAQAHARKAAEETQQINWTQAAEEHGQAATEYARAAKSTGDSEALRILKLLEEQHLKLATIIRAQDAPEPPSNATADTTPEGLDVSRHDFARADTIATSPSSVNDPASPKTKPTTSALAAARFGSAVRDSSPSLARDIASRRGIPQPGRNPPSAAAQARARQLSPESHRRNRSGPTPAPKIPPSVMDSQSLKPVRDPKKAEDDDAFAKFYSSITTGTMTKLSSVLAYAGLPLTADDVKIDPPTPQKLTQRTVPASDSPDVKKIFSKAALEAIEDEHRQRGHHGHAFGPAESFYVVQTGGGTYSYADIAKAQQQQQLEGIDEDDEEAFVDAREAQTSPKHSRFSSRGGGPRDSFGKSRTQEELELENVTLKHTLEQLATRLSEFETHAQDASMAALTQSMASIQGHAPQGGTDPALIARLRQVEQQLEQKAEEMQKIQNLAVKQEKTLKKYQSKWEEIKQSARAKERAKAEKSEKAAEVPAGVMEST